MKAFFPISIVLGLFDLAGVAQATDPKCHWRPTDAVDPDPLPPADAVIYPPVDVIDAIEPPGAFNYCTPTWDRNGQNYPPGVEPMACEVRIDRGAVFEILDRQEGLEPGQLVQVVGLTIRWDVDEIRIVCANSLGEGEVWARPATFPGSRPGSPFVPSD